jgi:cell division protein FtsZ
VIINVTGGPDLSLVEVSEASSIVQEAAHEDANIIFGAVVDPQLKGKVKITVIATGFGPQAEARPKAPASGAQTPVDMSQYAELGRLRPEAAVPAAAATAERALTQRLSIARRPAFDLPLAAAPGAVEPAPQPALHGDLDFDPGGTFDVPAFLRRQES